MEVEIEPKLLCSAPIDDVHNEAIDVVGGDAITGGGGCAICDREMKLL